MRIANYHTAILLASLSLLLAREAQADGDDLRILQSDASGLVVEYVPLFSRVKPVTASGSTAARYSFAGAISTGAPGTPELLLRSVTVAFPGVTGNRVELLKTEYEDIPNILLAPLPDLRQEELGPVASYAVDRASYAAPEFLPREIARLARIAESRGAFLGELEIHPYQYNPSQRTLRKYSRIIARITFGAPERPLATAVPDRKVAINSASTPPPTLRIRGTAPRNSVLASGSWFRFPVSDEGLTKLTGQQLLDAGFPASADPRTIKLYGNGGLETPLSVVVPAVDDLLENAVYLSDGGSLGQLDPSDYIIFYAKTTRGWRYDPATKNFTHYLNHFSETNVYWLTYGGSQAKAMSVVPSLNQPSAFRPTTALNKLFREDDKTNILSSGLEWVGQAFNPGDQLTYVSPLPGVDVSQPVRYKFTLGARSPSVSTFTVQEHASTLFGVNLPGTYVDGNSYYYASQFMNATVRAPSNPNQLPTFTDGQSQLRFTFNSGSTQAAGYIDAFEIFYQRFLTARNDLYAFSTPDTTAVAEYAINGLSGGQPLVFDVTRVDSVILIAAPRVAADTCTFQLQLAAGASREIAVAGPGGFKSVSGLAQVPNQNLHGDDASADYIIITHPDFFAAANRLKSYREQSPGNALRTLVVDVNQIYNEFGGGLLSPQAIRNYLRYVSANWTQAPRYVLLFGDGDFDYRRIIGTGPNWIPPWETAESFIPISTFSSDDAYVIFNTVDRVNLALGRLTPRSAQEANTLVDKIIAYETASTTDPWKLRFTFVADDGPQAPGANDGFIHTEQADDISGLVPGLFEKRKIYLYEYPTVIAPGGRRKPAVNLAIQNAINQGTLVLNFTGHGNPRLWANEVVFVRESDFAELHNAGKYFFLVAATCNYSHFDQLTDQSGSEILAGMPQSGAIGVFSATRPVFSFDNFVLNETLYRNLLETDSLGRVAPQRIGDVVYRTKQVRTSDNDRKYFLLGDPTLQLAYPKFYATVDSINHVSSRQVTQLSALQRADVRATVRDTATGQPIDFSGTAQVVVYDANHGVRLTDPETNASFTYVASGSSLFRGAASITRGELNTNFIVPKDISYSNNFGRITLYFSSGTADGAGYTTNVLIAGTDTTAPPDAQGPQIRLYLDGRGFRSGDVVSVSPTLIADLADSNGINSSTSGIGHRIEAWLDNQSQSLDLSDFYKSKVDTYREGTVEYSLGTLAEGSHKLRLRAWDTYNNSSTEETVFDVVTGVGLRLSNIYNFPNPFATSTVFTFEHNQVSPIDAEVRVYTVAGRLIQLLKTSNVTAPFVQVPWDGRDKDGDVPANGVYLYKVTARTLDGRFASEAFGKLSILK